MKTHTQNQIIGTSWSFKIVVFAASLLMADCVQAQSVVVTRLHNFSNLNANATTLALGKADGVLYGTTYSENTNGTIFSVNRDGSGYAVLHTFTAKDHLNTDSYNPGVGVPAPFVIPGNDGYLYGTTPGGGANNSGIAFRINPNGSSFTLLNEFLSSEPGKNPSSVIQGTNGLLYGTSGNALFVLTADGSGYSELYDFTNDTDGSDPLDRLLQASDGLLYGTAFTGGTNGAGTVFKISTEGTGFTVLHAFGGAGDGQNPVAGLIQGSDGALYGTTVAGGAGHHGTIFKINTNGSGYAVMHAFLGYTNNDGDYPLGELVQGVGNVLYGTTYLGGNLDGTIFRIGLDGSGYTSVYNFVGTGSVGTKPTSGLVQGQSQNDIGVLYGTTGLTHGSIFAALVNPPAFITPVTAASASNQLAIFWPAWAANYTLQSTTNLASPNWSNVTDGVPVFGVQVTSTNPAVFYRLASP